MGQNRRQAWVTCVTKSRRSLEWALVLAESLRRTQTTRRIAVIITANLGKTATEKLHNAFDDVFRVNDDLILPLNNSLEKEDGKADELRGKIFAFSLEVYEKCVFVSSETIILENCDKLFDSAEITMGTQFNDGLDKIFVFSPKFVVCKFLQETYEQRISQGKCEEWDGNFVHAWMKNNEVGDSNKNCVELDVTKFSMKTRRILGGAEMAKVVQFVDVEFCDIAIASKFKQFNSGDKSLGLLEKVIVNCWLETFESAVPSNYSAIHSSIMGTSTTCYENEPVAIVGMSCRFPKANNLEEFWNLLAEGQEGIQLPPSFRWKKEHSIFGSSLKERNTRAGFLATPLDEFDGKFFGLSPKEAVFLDPQARLLHEVVWEGLENSGIDPLSLRGSSTGIFTGSWMTDYKDLVQTSTEKDFLRTYLGNSMGATPARLSFMLGVTGPSIATESGCSSAIVALDLAINSLRKGETNLCLAGGVNLILHPFKDDIAEFVISPDGRCKTFDANANGFARAEGCGVLVLKRLSDALQDRDNIWAMIRGSAISQEGPSRSLGTPTVHCEALAMQLALKDAGVKPEQVSFVECHGTGTMVGDPMEIAAITQSYGGGGIKRASPLVIGSVKTNVGHTESCSGITGIIKTVLAMQHQCIPKHLNLETLNPQINLDNIPAVIPLEPISWPRIQGRPRLAGVSSFGLTGTDGHVILQEPPENKLYQINTGLERPLHILKFSAKTPEALDELIGLYEEYLTKLDPQIPFSDVAYTANIGRASFNHKAFILAGDKEQALKSLQGKKLMKSDDDGITFDKEKICFLFTGQGSQYSGMSKSLYDCSPVFRINFEYCDRLLRDQYNLSVMNVLWDESIPQELNRTIYSQVSIFCIEYCLLKLWESWGIRPDYVLGHSLGEFCAVIAAGIIGFEDCLKLVVTRSQLIDQLDSGSMLVIKAGLKDVQQLMKDTACIDLDIAAVNSTEQTVVAGDTEKIQQLLDLCKLKSIKAVKLEATHAFHSRHMDPILDEYRKVAESIKLSNSSFDCKYISGVTGKLVENPAEQINADYWISHTRNQVSFLTATQQLKQLGCHSYLEIGPQPILSSFVMQNIDHPIKCYPSLRRNTNDWDTILTSLGKLYLQGYPIIWEGFDKPYIRNKIASLPTYPFQRKSFWVDCTNINVAPIHPLLGYPISNASLSNIFQNSLSINSVPYLKDHCIGNRIIMPGAAFAEMCLSASYSVANSLTDTFQLPNRPISLENFTIETPLELFESKPCRVQVIVDLPSNSSDNAANLPEQQGFHVKVFHEKESDTDSNGKWILHANATFHLVPSTKELNTKWNFERIAALLQENDSPILAGFYKRISQVGLIFGETFKSIGRHWRNEQENGKDEIVVEMKIPQEYDSYILHPIVVDAMLQTAIVSHRRSKTEVLRVPVRIGKLMWLGNLEETEKNVLYLHGWWDKETDKCNVLVVNENLTKCIAFMSDVELVETNVKTIESILEQQNSSLPESWEEIWKPILGPCSNRGILSPIEPIYSDKVFLEKMDSLSLVTPEDWTCMEYVNKLTYLYMLKVLIELGWCPLKGDNIIIEKFCKQLKIVPMYQKLVNFYFTVFREENMVEYDEEGKYWTVTSKFETLNQNDLLKEIKDLENLLEKRESMKTSVKFYQNIVKNLAQLLTGNESALKLLFPVDPDKQEYSAETYYHNHPGKPDIYVMAHQVFENAVENWKHKSGPESKPILRVLEVGAGTGSRTECFIPWIREKNGDNFEYYYTDISPAFFSRAEKKFAEFHRNLKYAVFNIEENPFQQGIPLHYFDLVIAGDVIHATRSLKESLINLKLTLKPHGVLNFQEMISHDREITFSFGLFEHYWRFEDFNYRSSHPCVNGEKWKEVLFEAGYEYVYVTEAYFGTFGVICAEAPSLIHADGYIVNTPSEIQIKEQKSHWIVICAKDNTAVKLNLCNKLGLCNNKITLILHDELSSKSGWMSEIDGVLKNEENIQGIIYAVGMNTNIKDQNIVSRPLLHIIKKVLEWKKLPRFYIFTSGLHGINTDTNPTTNPSAATLFGMGKALKNENYEMFVRCVDFEDGSGEMLTEQILYELGLFKESKEKERVQIAYRNGQRYEPKFTKCLALGNQGNKDELKLPSCCDRYCLILPETRMIQDLEFDVLEEEIVGGNEVEVKVEAYALNFRDIVTILKPIKEFENLNSVGLDLAGVVTKVGCGGGPFQVGDRVFGVKFKENCALPSYVVLKTNQLYKIPKGMTFTEASTLPTVFATSLHCLVNVARVKAGETVLIHTGSGGVGLSAIQIARNIGALIITTAGNKRKRAYLRDSLGIEHVFHSRDTSFEQEILKVTNGRGVDVVLNSITGPGMKEASLNVCAKDARFVEMSKLSIWSEEEVKVIRPDVKYTVVDLTTLELDCWKNVLEDVEQDLNQGRITGLPHVVFDSLRIKHALQYFQKARHIGKVVVTMATVTRINGEWMTYAPLFNGDSTYIITGGLGGIGFEVCKWMIEKGATDIVLIGRNPPKPEVAKEIEKLENSRKCKILVKLGDVGDFEECKRIFDDLFESGCKPIRGVQHCAGVLRDNLYSEQTWEAFEATFNPKVKGTWNLHNLTKDMSLEYFVLYSSLSANVGTPGQSNHTAANCFEDAFAHYRYSLGLPGTSINWGQWSQVGCAKEINIVGILPISMQHMLNGLEMALRSNKVQVTFASFESFTNFIAICPIVKSYIDERMLKNDNKQITLNIPRSDQFWEEVDSTETKQGKIEVVCGYIKSILRSSLRMEPDEPISEDADLQELGVDSLMAIEFKNSMQSIVGSRVTLTTASLKDCKTIKEVATVLIAKAYDDDDNEISTNQICMSSEEYERLLNNDCELDSNIRATSEVSCKPTEMKTILITGVSGQLGPYILSLLTINEAYKTLNRIICLIRVKEGKCPKEKLRNVLASMKLSEKVDLSNVECIRGDVTNQSFGLDPETYENLCASVDGIIHLAIKSNHVEMYRNVENGTKDLRSVNVGGTVNVLRFAATMKTKYVYQAGTIVSVGVESFEGRLSSDWPDHSHIKAVVEHNIMGYPTTKYVCEMLMKQANERGIPCKVFRFPWITGESESGRLNYTNNHYILRFLSYLKIRSIPDAPIPAIVLPVNVCADWSLKLFWNDETPNEVYNIAHPKPELEVEFMRVAKEHFGIELELVDWRSKEFVEKLYATDMPMAALKEIYEDVDRGIAVLESGAFHAIQGYLKEPENFFVNKKVEKYLPGFSSSFVTSTTDIIKMNLEFVKKEGLFAKFGI